MSHLIKERKEFCPASTMAIEHKSGDLRVRGCGRALWANILDKWQYATGRDTAATDSQPQTMAVGELG